MKWKFKSPTFMCIFGTVSMQAVKIFLFHEAGKLCKDLEFWRKPNVKNSIRDTLKGPKLFSTHTLFILFSTSSFQSAVSEGLDEWIQYARCERHISFHRWVLGSRGRNCGSVFFLILPTPQTDQGNSKHSFSENSIMWQYLPHQICLFVAGANCPCYSCKITVYKSVVLGLIGGQME